MKNDEEDFDLGNGTSSSVTAEVNTSQSSPMAELTTPIEADNVCLQTFHAKRSNKIAHLDGFRCFEPI